MTSLRPAFHHAADITYVLDQLHGMAGPATREGSDDYWRSVAPHKLTDATARRMQREGASRSAPSTGECNVGHHAREGAS